jgi:hypothetical protein
MIDNFYLFRSYYDKINYNTNIKKKIIWFGF